MEKTVERRFRIARRDHVYLKFILEAHEGLATVSTADKMEGIVKISYPHFFAKEMSSLLASLGSEISMEELELQPHASPQD